MNYNDEYFLNHARKEYRGTARYFIMRRFDCIENECNIITKVYDAEKDMLLPDGAFPLPRRILETAEFVKFEGMRV